MSRMTRWSCVPVSLRVGRLALIPLLVAVFWLALPSAATANYSTNPGWYWLNPLPAGEHGGVGVAMFGSEAWTTGTNDLLLHSTDSGRTWRPQSSDARYLEHVTFVSPTVGWGVGSHRDGHLGIDHGVMRTTDGGHTWVCTLRDDVDPSEWTTDLFCLDATHAWAQFGGLGSTCYRTTDGGATWLTSTTPVQFPDVVFTSATEGWSVGNAGTNATIYHTTDAGVTWSGARTGTDENLLSITVADSGHIVAGGGVTYTPGILADPIIVCSTDTGETWSTSYPDAGSTREAVESLVFSDGEHGWAASSEDEYHRWGTVYGTTDGGATWTSLSTQGYAAIACNTAGDMVACDGDSRMGAPSGSPFASVDPSPINDSRAIRSLCFADGERGWGVSGTTGSFAKTVTYTTNAGARWNDATITLPGLGGADALSAICIQPPSRLWAVGTLGTMVRSTDEGATWAEVDSTTGQNLTDVTFADADNGWAAGGGSLISTVDGGQSWNPNYLNGDHSWTGVACATTATVCAAGIDNIAVRGCVVRTTNGGDTWRQVLTASTSGSLLGVGFQSALDGWAWGPQAALYRTTNGGATWTRTDLSGCFSASQLTQLRVRDVAFTSASSGYAVCDIDISLGGCGYILSTTDGGTMWAKETTWMDAGPPMSTIATSGDRVWLGGGGAHILANFDPDPDPPVTTESYDGCWSNQPVTLDFTATDPGVGVAYTRYSAWPDPWAYGASVTVPAPGDHSHDGVWPVQYQSVDWLAQAESPHTRLVKIDTVAPSDPGVALFPDPALAGGFVGPDPTFRFRGLDAAPASGVPADSSVTSVAVAGAYAYVGDGDVLVVFDVSNPWQPQYVSDVGVHGVISDVAVAHDLACVALGEDGLRTVDVSDPDHPQEVGSCEIEGDPSRVSREGEFAYVATGKGDVAVVDVHHPDTPTVVGTLDTEGAADLSAEGDRLCVATDGGLTVFDLAEPDHPVETGSCGLHSPALGVDLKEGIACVADGADGACLIEVGGSTPEILAQMALPGSSSAVALVGDLALVGGTDGVAVLDVSATAAPVLAGTIAPAAIPLALDADGEYLYAAEGSDGLEIFKTMATEAASYLVDGAPGTVPDDVPESGVGSALFSGLPDGPAYFHVRTRDQAGNWGPASHLAFTVDAAAPTVTTNADGLPHRAFTLLLSADDGSGSGLVSVEYRVDGGLWQTGTSVTFRSPIRHKRPGSRGTHTVDFRATDRVGNVRTGSCEVRIL